MNNPFRLNAITSSVGKRLLMVAFGFLSIQIKAQETAFYVSPIGQDANTGSLDHPFASPERARQAVRELKSRQPGQSVTVYFRSGTYYRQQSFSLTAQDSGTAAHPIRYRAYPNEQVVFHGGRYLSPKVFKPCQDRAILERLLPQVRDKIWVADLKKADINQYGTLQKHGFGTPPQPTTLELFINGEPQTLARYPNAGILPIGRVYDIGSRPRFSEKPDRGPEFGLTYDRAKRWLNAPDAWAHGKFSYGYNDEHLAVERIDTSNRRIKHRYV